MTYRNKHAVKIHRNKRGRYTPHLYGRSMRLLTEMEKWHVTTHIETLAKNGHTLARAYLKQEHGERSMRWIVRH